MAGIAVGCAFLAGAIFGWTSIVVFVLAFAAVNRSRQITWGLLIVFIASAALGVVRSGSTGAGSPAPSFAGDFAGAGTVRGIPLSTRLGQKFAVESVKADDGEQAEAAEFRYCVYAPGQPVVSEGDRIDISGKITGKRDLNQSGRAALTSRGCDAEWVVSKITILKKVTGPYSILSRVRRRLSLALIRAAPGVSGALMNGLVTGDDGALSIRTRGAFLATGTTHITAVSGANFALLVVLVGLVAAKGA